MAEKIEPALTEREWTIAHLWLAGKMAGGKVRGMVMRDLPDEHRAGAIALANAALPDDDPRKVTWAKVLLLNAMIERTRDSLRYDGSSEGRLAWAGLLQIEQLADALASYLPPRS